MDLTRHSGMAYPSTACKNPDTYETLLEQKKSVSSPSDLGSLPQLVFLFSPPRRSITYIFATDTSSTQCETVKVLFHQQWCNYDYLWPVHTWFDHVLWRAKWCRILKYTISHVITCDQFEAQAQFETQVRFEWLHYKITFELYWNRTNKIFKGQARFEFT